MKTFKGFKVLLVGGSLAGYAFLTTWEFAVALVIALFVHEWGHIIAMRIKGMKVKGMYFIPFVGAIVAGDGDEMRLNDRNNAFVSIMGPLIGGLLALVPLVAYIFWPDPRLAVLASWIAALNLFNLLPLTPLDGGHFLDALFNSSGNRAKRVIQVGLIWFTIGLGIWGAGLFFVFGMVYLFERAMLSIAVNIGDRTERREGPIIGFLGKMLQYSMMAIVLVLIVVFGGILLGCAAILYGLTLLLLYVCSLRRIWLPAHLWCRVSLEDNDLRIMPEFSEPVQSFIARCKQELRRNGVVEERQATAPAAPKKHVHMSRRAVAGFAMLYVATCLALTGIMSYTSDVPGAELAQKVLLTGSSGDDEDLPSETVNIASEPQ